MRERKERETLVSSDERNDEDDDTNEDIIDALKDERETPR
jgi:hypothetical protein